MRAVMVGVLGLGALLVSFAIAFFLWAPATATNVPTPKTASAPAPTAASATGSVTASAAAPAPASAPATAPVIASPAARAPASPSVLAETTGSIAAASAPTARQPAPVAAARPCQGGPDALGISRTVEIDTTGGPGFGFEHFKQHDFLQPGEVVLTFDDGPWPHNTPAVLAALAANCTKAVFFPIGEHSMWAPEILRQVAAAGHTIGSHTWSHKDLAKLPPQDAKDEIEKGISAVHWALGASAAPFFRFPALSHAPEMVTYLGERNIGIFSADMDSLDFKIRKPDQVIASVMAKLKKNGKGIVLMHDFQRGTADAAPELFRQIKAGGYKVVFVKAKAPLSTIATYDEMIVKTVKLPTLSDRPTSNIVRTIPD
jgi:peptidoglycan/xylan/chitin deacetylase (PgdA/CDA1 family)